MFEENCILRYLCGHPSLPNVQVGRPKLDLYNWTNLLQHGNNLVVGNAAHPEGSNWETMDPYEPGDVTYRARLEDRTLAKRLENTYDLIIANALFEHINPVLYDACVSNLYTMLKTGGYLHVEVPWLWAYHVCNSQYHFGGDFARFTREGLRRMFTDHPTANWKVMVCDYFIPEECQDGVSVFGVFRKE